MASFQNALDYVQDRMSQGVEFPYGPNPEIIRMTGIRVVEGSIPRGVRKELSAAVKAGYLGRLPKKKFGPEIFYHPNSRARAITEQKRYIRSALETLKKIYA